MSKQVLFLQGAGEGAYEEDKELAESLGQALGPEYEVIYPAMPDEENAPYKAWTQLIEKKLAKMKAPAFLVGHSIGGAVMIKWLSEVKVDKKVAGIFLMATPFWGGDGWRYEGYEELALPKAFTAALPTSARMHFYHCRDDAVAPFEHLSLYARMFPLAKMHELAQGGHQLNNAMPKVAEDIKASANEHSA